MERAGSIMGGRIFSAIIPAGLGLLGVILGNFPISFLGGLVPPPLLVLMPIYYWAIVRPDLMSPFWIFVLGVLQDLFSGGPPGVWAASFLATYALIDSQRDALASLSGVSAIVGFAISALLACGCAYFVVTIYYWHFPPLAPVMAELAMTVFVYVFAVFVLGGIHHRFVGPLRSDF
jgi:rod shape-determining protein MreD